MFVSFFLKVIELTSRFFDAHDDMLVCSIPIVTKLISSCPAGFFEILGHKLSKINQLFP
jgi:hypothetical protein